MAVVDVLSAWVGPSYLEGWNGRRLLLIAETLPEAAAGFRIGRGFEAELTELYLDGTMKNRQFTDVARLVLGHAAERQECEDFYRRVAFVNLPRVAQRSTPTPADWQAARESVAALVLELEPTAVLLLGRRLAQELEAELNGPLGSLLHLGVPHPGTPDFEFRDHLSALAALRAQPD